MGPMLTVKTIERQYDDGNGVQILFYDESGTEIGEACTAPYFGKPNAFLHGFVVKGPYRNRGYGTLILRYMIEQWDVTFLYVHKGSRAVDLYKRSGFEIVDMFDDMLVMQRGGEDSERVYN